MSWRAVACRTAADSDVVVAQVVKKVAKKPVKKVAKKAAKKAAPKAAFRPGQQMPAGQAVTELLGGFVNAFDLLRNLPK